MSRIATRMATAPSCSFGRLLAGPSKSHLAPERRGDRRRQGDVREERDPDRHASHAARGDLVADRDVLADVAAGAPATLRRLHLDRVRQARGDVADRGVDGRLTGPLETAHRVDRRADRRGSTALPDRRADGLNAQEREAELDDPEQEHEDEWRQERELDGGCSLLAAETTPSTHGRAPGPGPRALR